MTTPAMHTSTNAAVPLPTSWAAVCAATSPLSGSATASPTNTGCAVAACRDREPARDGGVVAERDTVAVGAERAVARDRDPDRAVADEGVGCDAEVLERAWARRAHDHRGAIEPLVQLPAAGLGREVERHCFLSRVEPVPERRVTAPSPVGPVHALDLGDGDAEGVAQHARAQRPRPEGREVDDSVARPVARTRRVAAHGHAGLALVLLGCDRDRGGDPEQLGPVDCAGCVHRAQPARDGVPHRAVPLVTHPRGQQVDVVAPRQVQRDPPAVGRREQPARPARRHRTVGRDPEDLHPLAQARRPVGSERPGRGPRGGVERGLRPGLRRSFRMALVTRTCSPREQTSRVPHAASGPERPP